jgi:hypothetical protein
MQILSTIREVTTQYNDVAIFHGMFENGALTEIPDEATVSDRIQTAIESSRTEKIFAFSIRFNQGSIENRVYGRVGIGISHGIIFRHYREDSGLDNEIIRSGRHVRESDDIDIVINRDNTGYNEFLLTDIEPFCIYIFQGTPFPRQQITDAARIHGLPIRELTEHGLRTI